METSLPFPTTTTSSDPQSLPLLVPLKPPKFTSKCISQLPILNPNSKNNNGPFPISPSITKPISQNLSKPPTSKNPLEIIYETMLKALDILKKPAIAAILIGVLLLHDPNSAFAASGGRIGGNSFSRRSSSEYSSRSYSVPRGGSSGFSYSVPYYAPFGGGGVYVGPAVGVGVGMKAGVLTAAEKTTVLKLQVGLLGMGRSLQRDLNRIAEVADTSSSEGLNYVLTGYSVEMKSSCVAHGFAYKKPLFHVKFSNKNKCWFVMLKEKARSLSGNAGAEGNGGKGGYDQKTYHEKINETHFVELAQLDGYSALKRTSLALLRHPDYCISGYSFVDVKRNNYLGCCEGVYKLPTINGSGDLKEALQKLGSIPASKILAVEVLWTPQNENDTLSERELLEDYPLLRPL
ncbi:hypothetical protein POTOM_060837 [Populus tomentosa]|uniref:Uncharacterized protein n=1 Tax=Populus tomentosa TaxID=118781 RepID=A0A8X8BVP9_POPTO|nr:hypothetical protein POTOM_060837 [Populus tomentosa]